MNYRKNGFQLLGLLAVAALSAMALAVASAQALTPGFLIGGKPVGTLVATVGAEQEGTGTLLVPTLNFQINCTNFTVDEGNINSNTDAKFILLYTGCTTLTNDTKAEIKCEVVEPIKAEALLLATELTNAESAVLAEKIKAVINLTHEGDLTKVCILPFQTTVKGEACLIVELAINNPPEPLVRTNDTLQTRCAALTQLEGVWANAPLGKTHDEILKMEETVPPTVVLDKLLFGAQPVTIDGSATVKLTGTHKGFNLCVSLF